MGSQDEVERLHHKTSRWGPTIGLEDLVLRLRRGPKKRSEERVDDLIWRLQGGVRRRGVTTSSWEFKIGLQGDVGRPYLECSRWGPKRWLEVIILRAQD